jgi:hypothetical protein
MRACAVVHYSDLQIEYPNPLAAPYVLSWHPQLYNHLIFRNTPLPHIHYLSPRQGCSYLPKKEQRHDGAFYYRH